MKNILLLLLLICATAAMGQTATVREGPAQVAPMQFVDHPQHASQHELAQPQDIMERSNYTYAQGERPLWEFGAPHESVPLGDVARAYRKLRAPKKPEVTLEK